MLVSVWGGGIGLWDLTGCWWIWVDGRVSVGTWLDGELPATGEPCQLAWPLDGDALEDLRWYLEDYLRAPFGVYGTGARG